MAFIPDQRAVEQLVAAALDPAFHDGVHAGHLDAAEHDLDIGVGEDRVEQGGELAVAVTDKVPRCAAGVVEVHGEVSYGLRYPGGGGMGGGAQDLDPAAGVLNDGQDVEPCPGQRD